MIGGGMALDVLSDEALIRKYRLNREVIQELCALVQPHLANVQLPDDVVLMEEPDADHLPADLHPAGVEARQQLVQHMKPAKSANNLGCKQLKGKKKTKSASLCKACKAQYGDPKDPKVTEDLEGRKWTRMMAGQKLSKMEFFAVFKRTWAKAATVENAQAGFRGTGMFHLNKDIIPETAFVPSKTTERVLPSTVPSLPTRPQSLPPLPTGQWSPQLTLTPSALLCGHQPSHPPVRPQSPAHLPARPAQSTASLTPLLPVEPQYFFPDEKVMFEEVVLEEVPKEDNGLFDAFTPQEEAQSQDEGPSTSTVSDILYYF
ncbi:hypothetical protein ACEWY4_018230 [Coilia grayii]|uniref:Uncharacterized protein n=1 Tax=Coilia grayii TaxID=363190 RepID=A0ABD1JLV7_9TELE